ncbi:unnamed protein product [Caenorhabditis bovis]|uniref:Small nuclear RNA-activating complex polypeptide 3 n=1 Tax=Caenorhabditis bovis TaxID=2654633 RepID=A0A8S1ES96_9PELO|nr:unnamed protein product [Caenorhabditis bovis]
MDRKFNSDNQWFISPLTDLKAFRDDALQANSDLRDSIKIGDEFCEDPKLLLMCTTGCSKEEANDVIDHGLNLDNFTNDPPFEQKEFEEMKEESRDECDKYNLNVLKFTKKRDEYCQASRQRKSQYITTLKYDRITFNILGESKLFRPQTAFKQECESDIVMIVDVLAPYNRILSKSELRSSRLMKPESKLMVRGETLLSDFRKKLFCLCDAVIQLEDGKELLEPNVENSTAELFPSSFIFINDTFYVDLSHENSKDISVPIREFMAKKKIFDPVDAQSIEGVKFVDLTLRLGQPYVYQHSGYCEHLLIFHDLKLLHPSDIQPIQAYPMSIYIRGFERKCDSCHKGFVSYVMEKSELVPMTYCFMCHDCFKDFGFSNGMKTHSFRAWPYYDLNNLKA